MGAGVRRGYVDGLCRANNEAMTSRTEVRDDEGLIQFRSVTEDEQGGYVCTADNSAGTVTVLALLNIRGNYRVSLFDDRLPRTTDPDKHVRPTWCNPYFRPSP